MILVSLTEASELPDIHKTGAIAYFDNTKKSKYKAFL